jgi:beta-lactamase class A
MRSILFLALGSAAFAQPAPPTPLARLEGQITRITRDVNANWGIYIKCLETGETISLNADQQMDTMSVIKIPLMAEAFRQIEAGKFKLTDRVTYTAESRRPGTGIIRSLDPGAQLTIKDLLTLMIIVSDNTATDLMYDKVGGTARVNELMDTWGLKSIRASGTADVWFKALSAAGGAEKFHQEAKTPFGLSSPRDMGKLLEMLEKGEAVSKSASDQMLAIMRGQVYSSRLPRYLSGWRIPHKTGDFLPYIGNDVGILESNSRHVVISVFTAKHFGNGFALEDAIGRIAELTGNYFSVRP